MRRNRRDTILPVSLFIAFLLSPAVLQQGLFSPWAWGAPLLFAALAFAVLSAMLLGAPSLAARFAAGRKAGNGAGEAAQGRDSNGEEAGSPAQEETAPGPDQELADALRELEPANYMDLVRALQEMGRVADALEVLAHVAEAGDRGDEVAQALRRMRQKLHPGSSGST